MLRAPVLTALSLVALGEAQALCGARAEVTAASPGVLAKLHAGASGASLAMSAASALAVLP